jgi:hypothetical protein
MKDKDELPRQWSDVPKARDLPHWRIGILDAWDDHGMFRQLTPIIQKASGGREAVEPDWQFLNTARSQLWFVNSDMAQLLLGAAPSMPAEKLRFDLVPDRSGFVFFETPIPGIDADGSDNVVSVGAMLWGPAIWTNGSTPCLGIAVYTPFVRAPWVMPIGTLIWPFGESPDALLEGTRTWPVRGEPRREHSVYASMAEDRRRLLALWMLASSPGITEPSEPRIQDRPSMRQSQRRKVDPTVRVIQLRRQSPAPGGSEKGREWHLRHRFAVSGYWRTQHYGPKSTLTRPQWIDPYMKGPDSAPLLDTEKVKAWTR